MVSFLYGWTWGDSVTNIFTDGKISRPQLAILAFHYTQTRIWLRLSSSPTRVQKCTRSAPVVEQVLLCGPEGTRTPDLITASDALYQLSYRPRFIFNFLPKDLSDF